MYLYVAANAYVKEPQEQKAGVSHHPSLLSGSAICIAPIVCLGLCVSDRLSCVCAQRWGVPPPWIRVHVGEKGSGRKGKELQGDSAYTCQEQTERKWGHTKKEGESNREKVWCEKGDGGMRTFLRSPASRFQGSYIVVSQQQASSAASQHS